MDTRLTDEYFFFTYDPILYGYNTTYWRDILPGAALTPEGKIRVNASTIASKPQYVRGDFRFELNVPTEPTTGDIRRIGVVSPAMGVTGKNAAYFKFSGDSLTAVVVNGEGTLTESAAITWDANWTATDTEFRIHWNKGRVVFYIGGLKVAEVIDQSLIPVRMPLSLYIENKNYDNLDLTYVSILHAEKVVSPEWLVEVAPIVNTDVEVSETVATTESVSANVSPPISSTESVALTEDVTVEIP